jgi:hypothetical protein
MENRAFCHIWAGKEDAEIVLVLAILQALVVPFILYVWSFHPECNLHIHFLSLTFLQMVLPQESFPIQFAELQPIPKGYISSEWKFSKSTVSDSVPPLPL